ncbi:hypothetical protein D9C73_023681 [Collichthys lucidus]|uniref:Uncharacterized protein n=1 Tax=Collichthys lucidus TaxID=240159 RepID=A0A4U5VQR6_COLLU|nr:hypothetical protein D9C73_023681 [Collichthys lucidus]
MGIDMKMESVVMNLSLIDGSCVFVLYVKRLKRNVQHHVVSHLDSVLQPPLLTCIWTASGVTEVTLTSAKPSGNFLLHFEGSPLRGGVTEGTATMEE